MFFLMNGLSATVVGYNAINYNEVQGRQNYSRQLIVPLMADE